MTKLPVTGLEHPRAIETRQPAQLNFRQRSRQLRSRWDIRQIRHNLTPDPDILEL